MPNLEIVNKIFDMKRLLTILILLLVFMTTLQAQEHIRSNTHRDGMHTIEAYPSMFEHQTEQYLLCWNYISSQGVEAYYISIFCNDQVAPWYVSAGDKAYIKLLMAEEYTEISALLDAQPEKYTSTDGSTKYRTLATYRIAPDQYDLFYKGFDRFILDVKMQSNNVPVRIAVKMPFSAVEHMLMSYLDIMIASGR